MDLKNKKILIISPHPDDEIICCGGLIAKAKNENAKVFVLFMATGYTRQLYVGSTDEKVRMKEAENVSKFCGYEHKFQFIGDEFMRLDTVPQKHMIEPIEDKIKEMKPDIVVIPNAVSFDQDHRGVFTAAMTALRPVPADARHLVPVVLEMEEPYAWSLGHFKPNFYVKLARRELEFKLEALKLHATQLREDPFPRSVKNLTRLAEMRGKETGSDVAEAYFAHRLII